MHLIARLESIGAAKPPKWLSSNTMYLTLMGSQAYGCATEESDTDVYGFAVPLKDMVFPHLAGEIPGFGRQVKRFEQYQESHLKDGEGREYDVAVYGIVKYFQLVMDGNPNMVDSLFTPRTCVIHSTALSEMVRARRRLFLSKKCFHTFRGYSYAQLHKMTTKDPKADSKRLALREKYGFDVKFGLHLVRLVLECFQILTEGDIDLQRDREVLKAIRRGEWTEQTIREWFAAREKELEKLYAESISVPPSPDEDAIKTLLLECLEHHYGSLTDAVKVSGVPEKALAEVRGVLERYGY